MTSLLLLTALAANPLFLPGPPETERFKAYFEKGEQLYQAGDIGAAIWNFKRADAIRVTPEVAYDLAKCHEKLGDQAFSVLYYRLYLKRAPNANDALDVAERVGSVLAHAEGEGRGLLEINAPLASNLTLGTSRFPEGPIALFLPPGEYDVSGMFAGLPRTMVAQVRTGKTTSVVFEPLPPPLLGADGAPAGAVDVEAANSVSSSGGPSGLRIGAYSVAAAGLVAVGVGTVLGLMAAGEANQSQQDKTITPTKARELAGSASSKGLAANLLWGVGGAAVAGGVVMFVFSMPEPGMKSSGGSR